MHRRHFLAASAALAVHSSLEPGLLIRAAAAAAGDDWGPAFAAARARKPWLIGFETPSRDRLETPRLETDGIWPAELAGAFYRNGPARHVVAGHRYRHWFDGDGMLQKFTIHDGRVAHLGRYVATSKYTAEVAADRPLADGFGTRMPDVPPAASPDAVNPANISVIAHAGRLLALWEAGSPHEIDPATLDTIGRHAWSDDTSGMPFTAHPRVDQDGGLWGFGYALFRGALVLYHIGSDGKLRKAGLLPVPNLGMVHDFMITARHIVIPIPPLAFEANRVADGASFLDAHVWKPALGTRVLLVDKDDFAQVEWRQLPPQWIFHYGNAWEEADGAIRFDACRYDAPGVMFSLLRYVMRGEVRPAAPADAVQTVLRPGGAVEQRVITDQAGAEFPRVDPRRGAARYRQLYCVLGLGGGDTTHPFANSIARHDLETGDWDVHRYGPDEIVEEHVFVPRPGSVVEGDGWLLGTTLDAGAGMTRLNLLDARRLADGPVARAHLPYPLPLGLHGNFVGA